MLFMDMHAVLHLHAEAEAQQHDRHAVGLHIGHYFCTGVISFEICPWEMNLWLLNKGVGVFSRVV